MTKHWVVVETGGTQRFIFGSNRLRHVIGASELVLRAGTSWVREACAGLVGVREVQLISGKARLLVDEAETGRILIHRLSDMVLARAPGLEVTGVVGPGFDEALPHRPTTGSGDAEVARDAPLDHVTALRATFRAHGRVRAARPARLVRDTVLPWHELCRETGMPSAGLELYGTDPTVEQDWHPAGAGVLARSRVQREARQRLTNMVGEAHADVIPKVIDDLRHDGWIAVIHADGNGVGALLHHFPALISQVAGEPELSLDTYCRYLSDFASELEEATRCALRDGITEAVSDWSDEDRVGVLLPVVVGGDDVTLACHARLARPLVRGYLRAFEEQTRHRKVIAALTTAYRRTILGQQHPGGGLTAAAGIAIVKPHHPFAAAYDLAEELTSSAKQAKRVVPEVGMSGYDLHVAHESTLRPLPRLRAALTLHEAGGAVYRHGGPYLVREETSTRPDGLTETQVEWLRNRDDRHLDDLLDVLDDGRLSSARAHDLRGALDRGLVEYEARCRVVVARAGSQQQRESPNPPEGNGSWAGLLDTVTVEADTGPERFVRLVDAMLLNSIEHAPAAADEPEPVLAGADGRTGGAR
ncbi:MAG: hypothetical protein HYR62_07530 [Actinobacteria bacterium]|nr:hypothetical protein [Actinomycetota bacterium]MBI3686168.1 hypothetical protein [Actinomycetota bacterium]